MSTPTRTGTDRTFTDRTLTDRTLTDSTTTPIAPPDAPRHPLVTADRVVGRPMERTDGWRKVRGQAAYTADVPVPGLVHAALVPSTVAAGTIRRIDTAAAAAAPGVLLIMTHENAPRMHPPPTLLSLRGASFTKAPIMQDTTIRWNGEPVAVVVAETPEQADHAASLVTVEYDVGTPLVSIDEPLPAPYVPDHVQGQPPEVTIGDADAALALAPVVVDHDYPTPFHNHAAIEPHATTVVWHDEHSLTMWDATQSITLSRATLVAVFDLRQDDVRVVSHFVGGAFGGKNIWNHQILCVAAAKLVGRPVRMALSRADVFRATGGRTAHRQRVALGARHDGTLDALIHEGVTAVGVGGNGFAEQFTFPARTLYRATNLRLTQRVVDLHMPANASMRAPGESVGSFALESALDELAWAVGLDPIELRRRLEPSVHPVSGLEFSSRNLVRAFAEGAARFGWADRAARPRARRDGEWWTGQGVATMTYPHVRLPGAEVELEVRSDGSAVVRTAAHEMGMGTATVQTQLAAEQLGLDPRWVSFEYGDSRLPSGPPAGGSAQTASVAAAIRAAFDELVVRLLELVPPDSPLAGAAPSEVEARDAGLRLVGRAEGHTFVRLLELAGKDSIAVRAAGGDPVELAVASMHSYGAQFCEVRVSEVTGEVRVSRWLGVFDTGRIFNPRTAASQFRGSIVMGIGQALTEEVVIDERTGRIMNPSMAEYHVPVHADVPAIDVTWLDEPDPLAPFGGKGVGEIGIVGVAGAIANAVYHASGRRVRDLPITPDKVLAAPIGGA